MDNKADLFEIFGWRAFPQGNRLGYFKLKLYVGADQWIDVDSFKLMRNTDQSRPDEFYVLPPSEKDPQGKFRNFATYSLGLKTLITQKAIDLYKSSNPASP